MFDALYTLAEGQCVYQGATSQLVPFLSSLGLNCPSYHNPASFIIEVSCGEYGDNIKNLVNAIGNGKHDVREGYPFQAPEKEHLNNSTATTTCGSNGAGLATAPLTTTAKLEDPIKDKNDANSIVEDKFSTTNDKNQRDNNIISSFAKNEVSILMDPNNMDKKDNVTASLLGEDSLEIAPSSQRYPVSELTQFWIVLKRTLLFSRRDWVSFYLHFTFFSIFKIN